MPQLKPTRGIRLNRSHPFSRGLVGLWLFNEGSGGRVFDLSGRGHGGVFVNTPTWTSGKFGSTIDFVEGDTDYINVGDIGDLGQNYTIAVGIKPDTITAPHIIVGYRTDNRSNANNIAIQLDHNNADARFLVRDNSTTLLNATASSVLSIGVSYQLAAVRNGNSIELFIDGISKATDSGSLSTLYMNRLTFGNFWDDLGNIIGNANFDGLLDYVMIYNRTLSASEIAQLHREPFCMFEEATRPKLIGGQIVNLAGSSVALSSLSATAKAMRKVGGNVVSTTDVTAILNLFRSLLYIESNWKREALFNGMTANAFKLGTTLSLGWFWVRVAGCSVLYRGSSMGEIDFVNILAVAEQDACEISPPSYISHNSGSTYFYVVRRFNNCGYQECTLSTSVKVSIESTGELAKPQPNKVFDSVAELVDGNKIKLVWYYCPLEQKSQPMCFNVYYDGRSGQINYENPLAIIGYKGRKFYSYQCGALEAGRYLFAIRTEDASGKENSSLARLRIQFDPTNPDAIDILSAEGV